MTQATLLYSNALLAARNSLNWNVETINMNKKLLRAAGMGSVTISNMLNRLIHCKTRSICCSISELGDHSIANVRTR